MGENITFRAPLREADAEFTEKRSRFIGSVRAVASAEAAAEIIKGFPLIYPKSNHHCWGYRIGVKDPLEHCSDAGEPTGTAGRPIVGVLKKYELTNTLLVVTRYYGGIKLGVRGLIDAYKHAAELAVEEAGAAEMEFYNDLTLHCGYDFSKTLTNTLRKWGFADDCVSWEYESDVTARLEAPVFMREEMSQTLQELRERGLLTAMQWSDTPLTRPKRR